MSAYAKESREVIQVFSLYRMSIHGSKSSAAASADDKKPGEASHNKIDERKKE